MPTPNSIMSKVLFSNTVPSVNLVSIFPVFLLKICVASSIISEPLLFILTLPSKSKLPSSLNISYSSELKSPLFFPIPENFILPLFPV